MGTGTVQAAEVKRLRAILLAKLGLAANAAPSTVLYRMMERSTPCGNVPISDPKFDLGSVFENAGITPHSKLYYWRGWDEMDRFDSDFLMSSISELWASEPPDDVNVFDDALSWLITVEHTGQVGCMKL